MDSLYKVIREINSNDLNVVCTVVDGGHFGEKALFSNGALLWETQKNGFFTAHLQELSGVSESETRVVDGEQVFCEVVGCEKQLIICGGGHVSIPIIKIGVMMGFSVTVLEDRPKFANDARKAGAHTVICDEFTAGLKQVRGDKDTYFVIVTRGHRYDMLCLEEIAKKEFAYIGMIGSKSRVRKVMEYLVSTGSDPEVLKQVHTPIGLDIGAETPAEIAVAVMAEIIEVKNARSRSLGYSKKLLRTIMDVEVEGNRKVLCTIVTRKGSAPRNVGTKMLILPDGTCVGTIGGGCFESRVFRKGIHMLRTNTVEPERCTIDMTGRDAEDDGMVCGGTIDVMLEVV